MVDPPEVSWLVVRRQRPELLEELCRHLRKPDEICVPSRLAHFYEPGQQCAKEEKRRKTAFIFAKTIGRK